MTIPVETDEPRPPPPRPPPPPPQVRPFDYDSLYALAAEVDPEFVAPRKFTEYSLAGILEDIADGI
jgi:hypothetical protein